MCFDFFSHAHIQWQSVLTALTGAVLGAGCAVFASRYACLLGILLETSELNENSRRASDAGGMALKVAPEKPCVQVESPAKPDTAQVPGSLPGDADGYSLLSHALVGRGWLGNRQPPRRSCSLHYGCAILMALVVFMAQQKYGWGFAFWGMPAAAGILCVLAIVDAKTALLPDALTLPLLWLGLALAWVGGEISLRDAVGGAMAGYLFLWLLFWLFKCARGYDGMGYGDFKLFAALGAWVGWSGLPYVLLAACLGGILFACIKQKKLIPAGAYPFGPFLALSGLATLLLDFCVLPS